ncbi:hypothetical protein MRS44_008646 [Fusarium solani]|uniref:uncharacterized protein n=1 Tax=Fusarium solani TaxID=169388 RepID=UPI0032C4210C|nr:hypothetical protein MRS44_008646 [Fusarium solani]
MAQSTSVSRILSLSTQDVEASDMIKGDRPIRKICKASIVQMICGILIFFTTVPSLALVIVVVIQGLKTKRSRRAYAKKGVRVRKKRLRIDIKAEPTQHKCGRNTMMHEGATVKGALGQIKRFILNDDIQFLERPDPASKVMPSKSQAGKCPY